MLDVRRRKVWKGMTVLGLVAAAAAILMLGAGVASAKKPPKEPPQDPSPDTGIIFFNFSSTIWSMASDGSNRQSLGLIAAYHADPSELTHDGERWFLTVDTVDGTYPNGNQRWELFAVSQSGRRQLTDNSDVEIISASWDPEDLGGWPELTVLSHAVP
ncbi:MAG: hypothetical protein HQ518_28415, partial [Rhodopirellula sp.]|nr:hypothetical protein [Rhodopirellula sp.]